MHALRANSGIEMSGVDLTHRAVGSWHCLVWSARIGRSEVTDTVRQARGA